VVPGCDDAPLASVPWGKQRKVFTLIVPYYDNPRFLVRQIEFWVKYPERLKFQMSMVIVDDASPNYPAEPILDLLRDQLVWKLDLFRIKVDIRWNWLAARNIGAHHAKTDWLLLTDIDHVLTEETLRSLVYGIHDPGIIYRFSRREHTGAKIHPHPNSWFMTKQMFWKVGGYNEAASGYYGTDASWRRRCAATAPIRILPDELVRYEYVEDSSTTRYQRKQPIDAKGKEILRQWGDKPPKVLSFPYEEIVW